MNQLLPYETIVKASEGDPEAVAAVLSHYAGYIRSCAKMDGQINTDMQEHIIALGLWKITEKELESRKKAIADKFHLKNG